jgi:Uroporphyrinogen decarboxylase (URO-D)
MSEKGFDHKLMDSQGTFVEPVDPKDFDIEAYCDYEAGLLEGNRAFWASDSGVQVYRRFRIPEIFSYTCRDMKKSLALQLGALQMSIDYKADIANFIEPWYGIGTVASAFGLNYEWPEGQAPAVPTIFNSVKEALERDIVPIEETEIGKRTLEMIEYFLDQTKGKVPMSLTDTQSPLDTASFMVEVNSFFMSFFDNPEEIKQLLAVIADLLIGFTKKQMELIGDALVWPGHGFPSSREFSGLGMSDDSMIMISGEQYEDVEKPYMEKVGEHFGGAVFHSCGNWVGKADAVKSISNLVMADSACGAQTDPSPNDASALGDAFAGSGVALNTRIVGDSEVVAQAVEKIWRPDMKLVITTYCETPEDQAAAYEKIYEIAGR